MKRIMVFLIISCVLSFPLANAEAGTYIVGAKCWYAIWDSAVLDWFEKDIGAGFKAVGADLSSDMNHGNGYLVGPVIGYQTGNKKWAFSFAAMVLSKFSQDWSGSAETMNLNTSIDTTRRDFDLAVTYSLSEYRDRAAFLEYCKIYGGYKYQKIKYDMMLDYDTQMGDISYDYTLDAQVNMPTIGFVVAYPIFNKLVLGLQGGVGLALIDLKMKDPDGESFDIDPKYSFTFNTEGNLNYSPFRNLIMQLGFRYQEWYLKARSPRTWDKIESRDVTYGPTLTIVYAF